MRRRYQRGTLLKRGKREQVWIGRWLEDEKTEGGLIHRRHKSAVLGFVKDMGKREAQRGLDRLLRPINSGLRQVRHLITFTEFTERWKRDVLIHHKPSGRTCASG